MSDIIFSLRVSLKIKTGEVRICVICVNHYTISILNVRGLVAIKISICCKRKQNSGTQFYDNWYGWIFYYYNVNQSKY